MNFLRLVKKTRSRRRFFEKKNIPSKLLFYLVNLARLTSSAANLQPLRYIVCGNKEKNNKVFSTLSWAGYFKSWPGPKQGERPSAYIVILADKSKNKYACYDCGIAAQTILLAAQDKNIAGCMIGSIDRFRLKKILKIGNKYDILLLIALGFSRGKVILENIGKTGIKYYRDKDNVHHVPKYSIEEVVLKELS
ncbi:MAG: nitroreductase family protein [Candidatus Gygaella obscura]|nr:nitroreductase family protein [Candidatus Gygaella obscura]